MSERAGLKDLTGLGTYGYTICLVIDLCGCRWHSLWFQRCPSSPTKPVWNLPLLDQLTLRIPNSDDLGQQWFREQVTKGQ
jgi:hypothetical protein